MANPIAVAVQGKGMRSTIHRGMTILDHYGLNENRLGSDLQRLILLMSSHQFQATLPVTAEPLRRHPQLARQLQSKGVELSIHGRKHVDHTLLPLEVLICELQHAKKIFAEAGIQATGFRSPYLRWNADTLAALRTCGFEYDSSQALAWDVMHGTQTPDYERVLAFYGAQPASHRMALPRLEDGLVCIPYCLPDDEALMERLKLKDCHAIAEIWLAVLQATYDGGELFTLGLHPERLPLCLEPLRMVIEQAYSYSPGVWITRLHEVAAWQRALSAVKFRAQKNEDEGWRIVVQASPKAMILGRSVEVVEPDQAYAGKYRWVLTNELNVRSQRKPWIGLSPECPASLSDFLKQQGYLIESSHNAESFTCFLQRSQFNRNEERSLLAEIEGGDWPLVRLARWPGGARSALAITGDIDAFTIWDYGQRIFNG
jgi:hypothetical protein